MLTSAPRISRAAGRGALEHLAAVSVLYPPRVQRLMRKQQLVLSMRAAVRKVLEGYEKTSTLHFGPVDWRHDPMIFGLEAATAMCMEHALEGYLRHRQGGGLGLMSDPIYPILL